DRVAPTRPGPRRCRGCENCTSSRSAPECSTLFAIFYRATQVFLPRHNPSGVSSAEAIHGRRRQMSRIIAIASAAALGAALLASLAYGRPAASNRNVGPAICAPGSVPARIGGKDRSLRAGQQCRKRYDRQYHRYGFNCRFGRLTRRFPSAGKVVATIRLRATPMGEVSANGSVWVAEHNAGTVARVDPATNKVVARVSIPSGQPARLAGGPEGLWPLPSSDNPLQELDPATNAVSANITGIGEPDENCCQPAVGAG